MNTVMTIAAHVDAARQLLPRIAAFEPRPTVHFLRYQVMEGQQQVSLTKGTAVSHGSTAGCRNFHWLGPVLAIPGIGLPKHYTHFPTPADQQAAQVYELIPPA